MTKKEKAPRNRTLTCSDEELKKYSKELLSIEEVADNGDFRNNVIWGDFLQVARYLPGEFVDLLFLDPPYNLTKNYNGNQFSQKRDTDYIGWFRGILETSFPMLKPNASIYICADWSTSAIIAPILGDYFNVQNRITWEREKGRGAKRNWKNNTEDIWFCTLGNDFYFDVNAVKLKRKVIAPYKKDGKPKDWSIEKQGNFRITHPSNIWTDISIPFWSMPENTDHPTQKPEKLLAKILLASCPQNGFVFDPFLGSGTSAVVAKKLKRSFCGVEVNREYACWSKKRLSLAEEDSAIQGYADGVFWERNTNPKSEENNHKLSEEQWGLLE